MDAMIVFMGFVLLLSVLIVIVANSTNQQSQQLQAIYRRLRVLDGPAHVVAGAEEMRRDRSVHLDKLIMMEVELNQQNRNELTEDEINKIEFARFAIKGINEKLNASKDWMGPPYDLEWVEFLDRVPKLKGLYLRAATDHHHPNIVASPAGPMGPIGIPAPDQHAS